MTERPTDRNIDRGHTLMKIYIYNVDLLSEVGINFIFRLNQTVKELHV